MAEENLSPKAKENLQRNAESRQKDGKFIKLQPGEKRVLQFNPENIEQIEAEFNGKKTPRYQYTVTEPNNGNNNNNQEKYLTVGKRTSEEIDSYLIEGHNVINARGRPRLVRPISY